LPHFLHVLAKDPLARVWSPGDELKQAENQMEAPKKALQDANLSVKVRAEIAVETPEYAIIRNVAREENVSLVVMGARGRSIWQGLLLGSVSSGVLRYGDKDLLIMRYKTLGDEKEEMGKYCSRIFEKVLAPTDFSHAGNAAIERIKEARGSLARTCRRTTSFIPGISPTHSINFSACLEKSVAIKIFSYIKSHLTLSISLIIVFKDCILKMKSDSTYCYFYIFITIDLSDR
jgi:hypothetical protein